MNKQKSAFLLLLCCALLSPVLAQSRRLHADAPLTVALGAEPVWLLYHGRAGETITITTRTPTANAAPIDTTLEILHPSGARLHYADDALDAHGALQSDAVLSDITLPASGDYAIRIDSFNGVASGEVEVRLTHSAPPPTVQRRAGTQIIRGWLPRFGGLEHEFELAAGAALSLSARAITAGIDPLLALYRPDGTRLAFNDDHSSDAPLAALDAAIPAVAASGRLRVAVREFWGQSGWVELTVAVE